MHKLFELLRPSRSEILAYLTIGYVALFASGSIKIWDYYLNSTAPDYTKSNLDPFVFINTKLVLLESYFNPIYADFLVWMIVGLIVVLVISGLQKIASIGSDDLQQMKTLRGTAFDSRYKNQLIARWALRFAGFLLLVSWLRAFIGVIYRNINQVFFNAVTDIANIKSILTVIGCGVAVGASIYVFAVCCRLVVLKVRVFSDQSYAHK